LSCHAPIKVDLAFRNRQNESVKRIMPYSCPFKLLQWNTLACVKHPMQTTTSLSNTIQDLFSIRCRIHLCIGVGGHWREHVRRHNDRINAARTPGKIFFRKFSIGSAVPSVELRSEDVPRQSSSCSHVLATLSSVTLS